MASTQTPTTKKQPQQNQSSTPFTSASIGKKVLMAFSGIVSFGFVLGHMLGNLQIFLGQEQINAYAHSLHALGAGIWVIRIVLLFFFVLHIFLGVKLKAENLRAKPVGYKFNETVKASLSSRTMIWTGVTILAFFIFHILHYTARITDPRFLQLSLDLAGRFDVYSMVILGFESPLISGFYILAVGLLCFHLSHGLYSMFQSLGLTTKSTSKMLHKFAHLVALVLFLGFAAVPVAVLANQLPLPNSEIPTEEALDTLTTESPNQISTDSGGVR